MNIFSLVLVGLGRNKLRTFLTFLSVTIALFLFSALNGLLDTLNQAAEVGSEARLKTRNSISLVNSLPLAYRTRLEAVEGVKSVTLQNWFGGRDPVDPSNFYAQFGVDAVTFFPMYTDAIEIVAASEPQIETTVPPGVDPQLAAFLNEQTACVVGEKLMTDNGWELGQTIILAGTIFPGEWPFTIRAVYRSRKASFGDQTLFFHWDYLSQKGMGGGGAVGVYTLELEDPDQAAVVAERVDALFENSAAATRTETEQAFVAGFITMRGNVPFVIRVIGLAVVFAILLVAVNTMAMSFRERTSEIGVLKTLGFGDGTLFGIVLAEATIITLLAGILGTFGAKFLLTRAGDFAGAFLPPITVYGSTIALGIGVALGIGIISGLIPAIQASRLKIVDALRRVD